jgi:hypothetical protein
VRGGFGRVISGRRWVVGGTDKKIGVFELETL